MTLFNLIGSTIGRSLSRSRSRRSQALARLRAIQNASVSHTGRKWHSYVITSESDERLFKRERDQMTNMRMLALPEGNLPINCSLLSKPRRSPFSNFACISLFSHDCPTWARTILFLPLRSIIGQSIRSCVRSGHTLHRRGLRRRNSGHHRARIRLSNGNVERIVQSNRLILTLPWVRHSIDRSSLSLSHLLCVGFDGGIIHSSFERSEYPMLLTGYDASDTRSDETVVPLDRGKDQDWHWCCIK